MSAFVEVCDECRDELGAGDECQFCSGYRRAIMEYDASRRAANEASKDATVRLEHDPGIHFVADVPCGKDLRASREYVDVSSIDVDLSRRVLNSVRTTRRIDSKKKRRQASAQIDRAGGLRIGYAFWGFLGDHKEDAKGNVLSTPDGNATYSWSIVWEAMRRGHTVLPMMPDRDFAAHERRGTSNFKAFSQEMRWRSYAHLVGSGLGNDSYQGFPELDILLLEWRWPIPGRNTPDCAGMSGFQPDLQRQTQLLEHYCGSKTRVVVWDLDHKLTAEDEQKWGFDVVETSVLPRKLHRQRLAVQPPIIVEALMQYPTLPAADGNVLAYIGSRYERDDVLDEWIRPIANRDGLRGRIQFHGKWDREDCSIRWPGVAFNDRVTVADFRSIYATAGGVPLLAKNSYLETGFVTPRVWEAILFGSIPIGLGSHFGVGAYTEHVAADAEDLSKISLRLASLSLKERDQLRRRAAEKISFMDVRYFLETLERLA